MKVMISTVHIQKAVLQAIKELGPDKIIFLIDPSNKKTSDLSDITKLYKDIIKFEQMKIESYNVVKTAMDVVKKIDDESAKGNEIMLHVTEGRKTTAIAAMYAGYARHDKIKGIYYIIEETNKVLMLPLLEVSITGTQKKILREISKGNEEVKSIAEKVGKTQQMIYVHLKGLEKRGYLTDNWKITDAGRIVVL